MGIEKYNLDSEAYQYLTEVYVETGTNKKWTAYLIFCSLVVCLSSFQFGYNIGSVNAVTPLVKDYFEQSYFKEKYFDKLEQFKEGEIKLKNGSATYAAGLALFTEKKAFLEEKEKELLEAEARRDNYLDVMFSFDDEKIKAAKEFKAKKEKEIREKYNTTVEIFMEKAREKIDNGKIKLAEARIKLAEGKIKLENGTARLNAARPLLAAGRKKLDIVADIMWAFFNVMFIIGGMIGAFTVKYVTDRLGHKNGILFHHLFTVLGGLLTVVPFYTGTPKLAAFFVKLGRFCFGVQGGMACILVPSFLYEISPVGLRTKSGNLHTISVAFGILVSQILGLSEILGTNKLWHILLGMPIIPAVIGSILIISVIPDPPAALIEKRDEEKARSILKKLRASANVNSEIQLLCREIAEAESGDKIRFQDIIDDSRLRWPAFCAIILQVAQQLSGIQVVFFYSRILFEIAGVPGIYLQYAIVLTGIVNFLAIAIFMPIVSRLSRKKVLVYTMILMVVDLVCLSIFMSFQSKQPYFGIPYIQNCNLVYFSVAAILIFLVLFAIGLGPIPCMFLDECFQKDSRSSPTFLCIVANFVTALLVTLNFPFLIKYMGAYIFLISVGFLLFTIFLVLIKVPETKGRTVEEIQADFD